MTESGDAMAHKNVFAVDSPMGHRVVLTRNRWRQIVRFKHPILAGRESEVRDCILDPDVIRTSVKDSTVHLYYRGSSTNYLCVVVGGEEDARFVVTAYLTATVKKGQEIWTK
jgi:hypothetical protein